MMNGTKIFLYNCLDDEDMIEYYKFMHLSLVVGCVAGIS